MLEEFIQKSLDFFMAYGTEGLFIWSFIESIIFPIPPDVLLIGLSLQSPHSAIWYACVTTVGSVMGAALGYGLGFKAGRPLLKRLVSEELITKMEDLFGRYEAWAVGIGGFTPIPYKVCTIGAGALKINFRIFIIVSLISRGARFLIEGILLYFFGERAWYFITNYFEIVTLGIVFVVILGYFLLKKTKIFSRIATSTRKK